MIEFRPATEELLRAFYGPHYVPEHPMRAVVGMEDGQVLGVFGIAFAHQHWVAFLETTARPPKRAVVEGMRHFRRLAAGRRVFAGEDTDKAGADVLLRHLGFEPRGRYWECKGQAVEAET